MGVGVLEGVGSSFANLQGKCRFQVASRAQLPGTGWARAGMKFRLV